MHIGHVWVAWNNYKAAADSGGRFVLIVDDVIYYLQNLATQSWPLITAVARYIEDLTWLGMPPDEVVYSTRNAEAHAEAQAELGLRRPGRLVHTWAGDVVPHADHTRAQAPYHPWLVMVRVVDDFLSGVDSFWRGADLLAEMLLYDDTCRRLGYRACGQEYIPTVRREGQEKKESKSTASTSVRALREAGYTPSQIIDTLLECAKRSAAAGLADVLVPCGMLEAGEVMAMQHSYYNVGEARLNTLDDPCSEAVVNHHRAMLRRSNAASLRAECKRRRPAEREAEGALA